MTDSTQFEVYRRDYRNIWGRDWPFDDDSLRELEREAKAERAEVLLLMRKRDDFAEGDAP